MMNVKGIDVNDDDEFSGPKAFSLRPSVKESGGPGKKKKKNCKCWVKHFLNILKIWSQAALIMISFIQIFLILKICH